MRSGEYLTRFLGVAGRSWPSSSMPVTVTGHQFNDLTANIPDVPFFALPSSAGTISEFQVEGLYRNDSRVISLQLYIIANDFTNRCQVYGTAVPAS